MAEKGGTRISSRHEEVFRGGYCLLFLGSRLSFSTLFQEKFMPGLYGILFF